MIQNLKDYRVVKGYDVVSYFIGKPMMGKSEISTVYKGGTYQFATEENKKTFLENREKYRPAYGGFCAIAMTEGSTVDAHPEAYIIQDGRLLMFYAIKIAGFLFQDTRTQWEAQPQEFLKTADAVYKKLSEE